MEQLPSNISSSTELEGWRELLSGTWFEPGDRIATLDRIAHAARIAFKADICVLFAINPITQSFVEQPGVSGEFRDEVGFQVLRPPHDRGLTKQVLAANLMLVEDPIDLRFGDAEFYKTQRIRKFAAIALRTSRRRVPLGVLFIDFKRKSPFPRRFEWRLGQFGRLASRQLETTWLLRRYQSVARFGSEIINKGTVSNESLFAELFKRMGRIIDTSRCLVWASLAPGARDIIFHSRIEGVDQPKTLFSAANSFDRLLSQGTPIRLTSAKEAKGKLWNDISTCPLNLPWKYESALFAPLRQEGRTLGFLLATHPETDVYDAEDQHLLQLISAHFALAISNLRLFDQFRLLDQTGQDLTQRVGEVDLSQTVADKLREATQSDLVILFPYFESTQQFEAPPIVGGTLLDPTVLQPRWVSAEHLPALALERAKPLFLRSSYELYRQLEGVESGPIGSFLSREEVRSTAILPLRVGGERVGVLFFNFRQPQHFDEAQQHLIASLANYSAITLKNSREFSQEVQGRLKDFEILQTIDKTLNASSDLHELLELILNLTADRLFPNRASIWLLDPEREELVAWASIGPTKARRFQRRIRLAETKWAVVQAFITGPKLVSDVSAPEWQGVYPDLDGDGVTRSELDVPLLDGKTAIGVISLESNQPGKFRPDDLKTLRTLAAPAVLAIRKAQAFESEQRLAKDNEALFQLAKELATRLEPKELLDLILERALEVTNAFAGGILVKRKNGDLEVMAERGTRENKIGRKISGGIIGFAVERNIREPLNVDLTLERWRQIHDPVVSGMQSEIVVPFYKDSEFLGILNLVSPNWRHFRNRDERFLSALADFSTVTLQNAAQFESSRDRRHKLEALADVSRKVIEQLDDPDEVLRTIVQYALHLPGATIADLDRYEGDQWVAAYRARKDDRGKLIVAEKDLREPGTETPPRGLIAWVRENREALLVPGDAQKDPRHKGDPEVHSEMALPLIDRSGELRGILNVSSDHFDAFDLDDLEDLKLFAHQAVIALESSRNFADAERARKRLELLQLVGRKLAALSTMDEIQSAYDEVVIAAHREFGGRAVIRRLEGDRFELVAYHISDGPAPLPSLAKVASLGEVVMRHGILVIADAEHLPPGVPEFERSNPRERSFILASIESGTSYYGHLGLSHPRPGFFLNADEKLVQGLAQELAITIRRLEEVEKRKDAEIHVRDVESVSEIGQYSLDLMHRLSNDLGLVPDSLRSLKEELAVRGLEDKALFAQIEEIRSDVLGVLWLAKFLGDEITKSARAEKRLVPVAEIIESALDALRFNPAAGAIRVIREVQDRLPSVFADPNQITTVILSLLSNAREAMPQGGTLKVRAEATGEAVKIWVSDTGIGISSEMISKIFRLGFTTKPQGTGFGLWSVKRTLLNHNAEIEIQSEPGKGTTFILTLPLPSDWFEPSPDPQMQGTRPPLCLVDRRAFRLEEIHKALFESGFQVRAHLEYSLANEALKAASLTILVCTIIGEEELKFVRRLSSLAQRSLVLATAIDPDMTRQLFLAGASDVAVLPSTPRGLIPIVENALGNGSARRLRKLLSEDR